MSRIRSIHPTQWTDEQFVSCSPLARLLAIGIRNEADDNGIFEWKPLTLKMRLLPADNCDCSDLLNELVKTEQVHRYDVDGKSYGLIRNFTVFQRPKKPVYRFPVPNQLPTGGEPNQKNSEPAAQMEDVGEGGEKEKILLLPSEATPPKEKPGSRLADGWQPDEALVAWTCQAGFPVSRIQGEVDRFCDYWSARGDAKARKTDWNATWRNWIRRCLENPQNGAKRNGNASNGHKRPTAEERIRALVEDGIADGRLSAELAPGVSFGDIIVDP